MFSDLKIVTGSSNPELAKAICDHLGCQLTPTLATTFSDGELRIEIGDNVRGDDVFVVQPTCPPLVNRNLMQLCLMLDALKRASAGRITAVIPYYGYARQDRKVSPRAPISAKMVADFISVAGAGRVVTIDMHAGQIQGFFNCPVDNLYAAPVMMEPLRQIEGDIVIVSPDAGGVERARSYAKRLNAPLAIVDKRRDKPNQAIRCCCRLIRRYIRCFLVAIQRIKALTIFKCLIADCYNCVRNYNQSNSFTSLKYIIANSCYCPAVDRCRYNDLFRILVSFVCGDRTICITYK